MGLDFRKCHSCGKVYQYNGRPFCLDCIDQMDKAFEKVREYIYDHANASVEQVSKATEVDEKWIILFIREGRIQVKEAVLTCRQCGKPILSGELCEECKYKLSSKLSSVTKQKAAERSISRVEKTGKDKMHVGRLNKE